MSKVLDNYALQVSNGLRMQSKYPIVPHLALGLTGEAGEVADLIKKSQYIDGSIDWSHLEEELGDVLWYLQALCNVIGFSIEDLAKANVKKLAKRRPQDYTEIE